MNITFFITTLGGGGAERVVCDLATHLVEQGRNTEIVALRGKECRYKVDERVDVRFLQPDYYTKKQNAVVKRANEYIVARRFFKQLGDEGLLVCFLELPVALSLIYREQYRRKLIICERNNPENYSKIYPIIYRRKARNADGCVCQTRVIANWYAPLLKNGVQPTIIHNPIGEQVYHAATGVAYAEEHQTIATFGRMVPQKNHKLLIQAFAQIHQEIPKSRVVIYGEGPLHEAIKVECERLGISEFVEMPGFAHDVVTEMKNCGVFVLSSDFEGMPNALMEAMAMGLPCVSTDCGGGGAAELIINGENGLIVPCGDSNALALAVICLLQNKEMARKLAMNAHSIVDTHSPAKIYEQWDGLFEQVMNQL